MQRVSNASPGAMSRRGSWCWKGLRSTGLLQVILAILAVLFGIVSIVVGAGLYYIGAPIWCGVCVFAVAGILGLEAGRKKRSGLVIGYMVMSIISSMAACVIIGLSGRMIRADMNSCREFRPSHVWHGLAAMSSTPCTRSYNVRVGVDMCVIVISIAEFVISVVAASFTCCSLYFSSNNSSPHTLVTYRACPQQMIIGAPPQGVYFPTATVAYPNQYVLQPAAPAYQPQGQFQPLPQPQFQSLP
ncbi:membrane-spanning 4-domains subfamily A member 4A-like [Asterias amurensis]|uniref:membrane-spanning 4-domains subfamily A member 4A-like n=1 Tax=Asterias amurensis TaxID=7602 RepID=UPI003AB8D63F